MLETSRACKECGVVYIRINNIPERKEGFCSPECKKAHKK